MTNPLKGKHPRIPYLLAQARYLVGALKGDAEAAKAVGAKDISDLEAEAAKLETLVQAGAGVRNQAVAFAAEEDVLDDQVQRWITGFRRFYATCRRAAHPELPGLPRRTSVARVTPRLAEETARMIETARSYASTLSSWNVTPEFVAEGAQLLKQLKAADQKQQAAHGPQRVEVTVQIGRQARAVHGLIGKIVATAQYVHRSNPAMRRQYTLRVLYGKSVTTAPVDAQKTAS